eukprot:m51a1_g1701 hypothetical protein (273) ;mRNA; f:497087-497972
MWTWQDVPLPGTARVLRVKVRSQAPCASAARAPPRPEGEGGAAAPPGAAVGDEVTGADLWRGPSALLCRWVAAHAADFAGRRVLELGAGIAALPAVAAAVCGAAHVVATDGLPLVVAVLAENVLANKVDCHVRTLVWRPDRDAPGDCDLGELGFDYVIAADAVYVTSSAVPFLDTAMRHVRPGGSVLLAHEIRKSVFVRSVPAGERKSPVVVEEEESDSALDALLERAAERGVDVSELAREDGGRLRLLCLTQGKAFVPCARRTSMDQLVRS